MATEQGSTKAVSDRPERKHGGALASPGRSERDLDRLFEDVLRPGWSLRRLFEDIPRLRIGQWEPTMPVADVFTEKDDVVVKAELPGLTKDDVTVSLSGDLLTIQAEKKQEDTVEEKDYSCSERTFGRVSRTLRLPVDVHGDKATAVFENGVLTLRIPKTEAAKSRVVAIPVR